MFNPSAITRTINVDSFAFVSPGNVWMVIGAANGGTDTGSGENCATVQGAVNKANANDVILIPPGTYLENVTVTKTNVTLLGIGPLGSSIINPTTGVGLTVNGDGCRVQNLQIGSTDGSIACSVNANRFNALGCIFDCGAVAASIGVQLSSTATAVIKGTRILDCIIQNAVTAGIKIVGLAGGAVTDTLIQRCTFRDITTDEIHDAAGSGGSAAATFAGLTISDCQFARLSSGTEPTTYLNIGASNSNTGLITNCSFAHATNAAAVIVIGTGMIYAANKTVAGISTAVPA